MVRLVGTGVLGLDILLGGGMIGGSTAVIIGPVDVVKAHIAQQYILEGLKANECCLYVSSLDVKEKVKEQFKYRFKFDIEPLMDNGVFELLEVEISDDSNLKINKVGDSFESLRSTITKISDCNKCRIVINNLLHFFYLTDDSTKIVQGLAWLDAFRQRRGAESVLLYVMDTGGISKVYEEVVKSLCDYVFEVERAENVVGKLKVLKAPTLHSVEWHELFFTENGVELAVVT
ncbi:MAG: RAD55 family ATPase [Candidatus Bathyarchaeia archaeon]|jgi:KaiC/GvpD/RAD55 family RecA-like ATPase